MVFDTSAHSNQFSAVTHTNREGTIKNRSLPGRLTNLGVQLLNRLLVVVGFGCSRAEQILGALH